MYIQKQGRTSSEIYASRGGSRTPETPSYEFRRALCLGLAPRFGRHFQGDFVGERTQG